MSTNNPQSPPKLRRPSQHAQPNDWDSAGFSNSEDVGGPLWGDEKKVGNDCGDEEDDASGAIIRGGAPKQPSQPLHVIPTVVGSSNVVKKNDHHRGRHVVDCDFDDRNDTYRGDGVMDATRGASSSMPLHLQQDDTTNDTDADDHHQHPLQRSPRQKIRYYRIVYRGVVALLADPTTIDDTSSEARNGAYLSYGEIIASREERTVVDTSVVVRPQTPSRKHPSPRLGSAVSSPILSRVWGQREHRLSTGEDRPTTAGSSFSPPRSLVSGCGSVSSFETMRTSATTTMLMNHDTATTVTAATSTTTTTNTAATAVDDTVDPATTNVPKLRKIIRVDRVLTGGFAVDASDHDDDPVRAAHSFTYPSSSLSSAAVMGQVRAHATTPKRGNTHDGVVVGRPTPLPICDPPKRPLYCAEPSDNNPRKHDVDHHDQDNNNTAAEEEDDGPVHGYIYSEHGNVPIAIPLGVPPICEQGCFLYRVISSTPLVLLTGPSDDAPRTKGMLIPGTVHEVCLRISFPEDPSSKDSGAAVTFLRLTRRRGWIADRRVSQKGGGTTTPLMKDVSNEDSEECGSSVTSLVTSVTVTSTVATPAATANRRHKPPRRKRELMKDVIDPASLPRHVMGPPTSSSSMHHHHQSRHDTVALMDTSMALNTSGNGAHSHPNHPPHDPRTIVSPSSNISLLSDDTSSLDPANKSVGGAVTPDRSVARSVGSGSSNAPSFFLMRVNAPRGLRILDAPHFQVNNLIHGIHPSSGPGGANSSSTASPMKDVFGKTGNQSIFQTMAGHHTTTMTSKIGNPAVFDSVTKARRLPRGSVFEASKRMEASDAFSQGAGLIKLSDNSGWAIVPTQDELDDQYRNFTGALAHTKEGEASRAFEEVGNSIADDRLSTLFLRVVSKGGIAVSLPTYPPTESDGDTSPTSSTTGSSAVSVNGGLLLSQGVSQDSDVASSVGSSFLDAMFRTPKRKDKDHDGSQTRKDHFPRNNNINNSSSRPPLTDRASVSTVIPCGICVEVDRWMDPSDTEHYQYKNEFARLRGGQGWIPRFIGGKPVVETVPPPEIRVGSFWFRVQDKGGIKVRLGPSKRAPSIRSEDGVYFRFECGEFLRASEVVTVAKRNATMECYAKLYRNRHARLQTGNCEVRSLSSLTVQAEWVQVFGDGELFLEECSAEPRIERHKQCWRYNVVLDCRVTVRKGPSFEAEAEGVVLLGGESVLVNERVTGPGDPITWLRLKDGQGWVHNVGREGETLMIPHSLRHRTTAGGGRPSKPKRGGHEEIAYNTIIARLFHNDVPRDSPTRNGREPR
jgi:hypothetical protein